MIARRLSRAARSVFTLNRREEYRGLLAMLGLAPSSAVLDIGSGDGFWTVRFARRAARVVGLDPDASMLDAARRWHGRPNVEYVEGVAEDLPFPDASFDRVVSVSCLEHFADPERGLCEMARVLRPGGRLAISVDSLLPENSDSAFREWHRRRHFVTRYFREDELREAMAAAGLRSDPVSVHLFRSRLAARLRVTFIRNPRAWLPGFPVFYGAVRLADRLANDMHGQIVLVSASR